MQNSPAVFVKRFKNDFQCQNVSKENNLDIHFKISVNIQCIKSSKLCDRSHDPRNASGTETGTGSGKMGSMLEMGQYYTVRVRVRDREVDVPDPVPEAMGSRPIASGTRSGTPTFNWTQKGPGSISRTV